MILVIATIIAMTIASAMAGAVSVIMKERYGLVFGTLASVLVGLALMLAYSIVTRILFELAQVTRIVMETLP